MNILYLNVSELPFQVMDSGEKLKEYRKPTQWIKSRLFDKKGNQKKIDAVHVRWGYGSERPYFIREFKGFIISERNYSLEFTNCLKVRVEKGDFIIKFGRLIESSNNKGNELF